MSCRPAPAMLPLQAAAVPVCIALAGSACAAAVPRLYGAAVAAPRRSSKHRGLPAGRSCFRSACSQQQPGAAQLRGQLAARYIAGRLRLGRLRWGGVG